MVILRCLHIQLLPFLLPPAPLPTQSQEVGPVLSAPPIPNPDALRTKSVIGMPKTASAPNAAAGGMQGQALAAPVGPAGPCLGAEIRSKHDKVYCIAFVPPVPLSQHSGRASSSLLWWSSGAREQAHGCASRLKGPGPVGQGLQPAGY